MVQALGRMFEAEAARLSLWAPVFFGLGVALYFSAPVEPPLWSVLASLPPLAVWVWVQWRDRLLVAFLAGGLAMAAAGFAAGVLRTATLATPVLSASVQSARIEGRILSATPLTDGAARVVVRIARLNGAASRLTARILFQRPGRALKPGDWVRFRAGLRPPPRPVAPGAFDFARALWFQGVGATGFSLGPPAPIAPLEPATLAERAGEAVARVRAALSERIRSAIPGPYGPVATAFLTGERSAIDEGVNQAFRDSSLAHLLSISGLHMVMAGFGFFNGLRFLLALTPGLALRMPVKKIAAAGALLATFAYLLISGAATPAVRAFLMIALAFLAMLMDRPALSLRQVAVAALLILAVQPESLLDVSFQMSFAAVAALVAAFEWWQARPASPRLYGLQDRLWSWFAGAAATSLIAGAATAPFAAYHFHRVADYGVAANVLALPVVGLVVMPAGVAALAAMPLGLEYWPLRVMDWGLTIVGAIAVEVASWPGATHMTAAFPFSALAVQTVGALWLMLWTQVWRWFGVAILGAGIAMMGWRTPPDILIADGGKAIAVRGKDGTLSVSRGRRGAFEADAWLKADGDGRSVQAARGAGEMDCQRSMCRAPAPGGGWVVLAPSTPGQSSGGCIDAAVLVAPEGPARACGHALTFDEAVLRHHGAIVLWRREAGWVWRSVRQVRGDRPWSR
jgi:competence protein ComEC